MMKKAVILAILSGIVLTACNSDENPFASGAAQSSKAVADPPFTYSNTAAGPIVVEVRQPRREEGERILWIEFQSDVPSTAEVTVSFVLGVNGEGHVVRAYPFRGNNSFTIGKPDDEQAIMIKTDNAAEQRTLNASFYQAAGIFAVGLGAIVTNDTQNVDAIFRDVSVDVTVIPEP